MPPEVKIYECEVKKLFRKDGTNEWRWGGRAGKDALSDGVAEFRCKDCHGVVKLHGKHVEHGPAPHVEHRSKQDSEYCPAEIYFRRNPGREPRLSLMPVK